MAVAGAPCLQAPCPSAAHASHALQSSLQPTCCRSTSGLNLSATDACRPPVPLPRILSHGLQEREFHVHSEPVRQGLNKALGELERMTAGLWGIALQGICRGSRGNSWCMSHTCFFLLALLTVHCASVASLSSTRTLNYVCQHGSLPQLECCASLKATSLVLQCSPGGWSQEKRLFSQLRWALFLPSVCLLATCGYKSFLLSCAQYGRLPAAVTLDSPSVRLSSASCCRQHLSSMWQPRSATGSPLSAWHTQVSADLCFSFHIPLLHEAGSL